MWFNHFLPLVIKYCYSFASHKPRSTLSHTYRASSRSLFVQESVHHLPPSRLPNNPVRQGVPPVPRVQVPMGYALGADAVPMAVKHLFDFLDDEAEAAKISDPDVVHTWKNNALSLRFWVNMIKNPEFVYSTSPTQWTLVCQSLLKLSLMDAPLPTPSSTL